MREVHCSNHPEFYKECVECRFVKLRRIQKNENYINNMKHIIQELDFKKEKI